MAHDNRRPLSLLDAVMIVMGSMIGSGIFVAPALIAGIVHTAGLGAASFVWLWVLGGVITVCAALSFAELASAMPKTGGQYLYLKEAFSPFWGYLYGWTLFTVIQTGFIAAVAIAFANYAAVFVPSIGIVFDLGAVSISGVQVTAIVLIFALTAINARGLRAGASVQNVLGFAKVFALLALVVFGLTYSGGSWSNFQPLVPSQLSAAVLTASAVAMSKVLFAYDSWNVVTFVAEKAHNPARLLPRALIGGTAGVMLIYALATTAYLYVMPLEQAAVVPGQRIAAQVAETILGPIGLTLISAAILISTAGCDNGLILSGPWLYHAMAKDGLFFKGAASIDTKHGTPVRSLQYQALWASILILSGSLGSRGSQLYSDLLTFTSFASLLFNTLTVAGLFVLRRTQPELHRPYRVTAYPLVPLLFLGIAAFFLVFIAIGDPRNAGFGLVVIAAGTIPYVLWRRQERIDPAPVRPEVA